MMNQDAYPFARLNQRPEIVEQIKQLEQQLHQELGEEITLIAFTKKTDEPDYEIPSPS
ncbi:hypothetical protein [Marinicrinis sediminis]|uniref:Uncharacterized protein n=1 Tax=Marinicrinis sediminis TaxID=1652465 RepID=A0ABW5R5L3_9BACL